MNAPFRSSPRLPKVVALAFTLVLAGQTAPLIAQQKVLTLDDYAAWSRITNVELSPDGHWMTFAYSPNDGDATLHVRALDGTEEHTATNGASPAFSEDGRWVAFLTSPTEEDQAKLRKERKPVPRTLELIDLTTGTRVTEADAQSFRFSGDSRYIAIEKRRANDEAKHTGRDLVLRTLATGVTRNFGNVSAFAFNDAGTRLAWLIDAADKAGNGVYVMDPMSGAVRPLDTDTLRYDDLAWSEDGTALAALRGETPEKQEQRANSLVVFRSLDREPGSIATVVYDPAADASFPSSMVLSELGTLAWSKDGTRIFTGIKEQKPAVEDSTSEDERANVEVWHWADERLQSVQKVRADADRRATWLSVVDISASPRFLRLADESMPNVQRTESKWAIGQQDRPYRMLFDGPGGIADIVRIDMSTGEHRPLVERVRYSMDTSPDGRWHLWFKDGSLQATDVASGQHTDLSALAAIDFTNTDADRPGEKPSWGIAGWARDGRSVLVYSKSDVWMLPLGGNGRAVNLTQAMGERDQVRFRVVSLDEEASEEGIDTSRPIILSAYGERNKKSGYWSVMPGEVPRPLIWQDRMIGGIRKAENADRVIFTSQTFEEFPDYYVSNAMFQNPRRVTDANPQRAEYAWGRRVLVDYTDQRGNPLQATLALPAGYVEGRQYPMLVYFYEKMSQRHHEFSLPVYDDRPHMSTYASDGYLVLMPDIVYTDGQPGSSALDDVTSAVRKVIELGYADPQRIGLQGHSWGGYQSSFIVTQTDLFAAVVTGAPLTNLESMHNILYKSSGGGNAPLIQWGQGRMGTVPWKDPEGYASQSPVRHVENITTPFLILHGTADGAVDWNQGLEFYIAARRAGKEVILLSYPDEPHHLAKEANQKDFQRRMKQYFDHHLKGAPAADWMTRGIPFLDRGRIVTESGASR
jgi:dipeptidyl aminopeptidase/acylaminoacyl peptidase